jgi:hypothetical protein
MRGVVGLVNRRDWVAVRTADGWSVCEVLGSAPELGEEVEGELDLGGGTTLRSDAGEEYDVVVQLALVSKAAARRMLEETAR